MDGVRQIAVFLSFRVKRTIPEDFVVGAATAARDNDWERDFAFAEIVAD